MEFWRVEKKENFSNNQLEIFKVSDNLLIPMNVQEKHWTLGIIRPRHSDILYYDSLNWAIQDKDERILKEILQTSRELRGLRKAAPKLQKVIKPKQEDDGSCGVFSLLFGQNFILNKKQNWSQKDIPEKRLEFAQLILVLLNLFLFFFFFFFFFQIN